jgi:NAD+ synthase/NAD+ synthase (glutamine-hydrolysing)
MLRITIAQLNLTVGDIEGNVARMVAGAQQAAREQADLIVFSELALCGYYPGDMLDETPFLQRVQDGLAALLKASADLPALHWVVGAPTPATGPGKRLHNSLLVLQGGAVRLQYAKQLLPTYNIFDERRHGLPILYVNQVGGHDQVVYDGASFAAEPEAGIVFEAPRFVEDLRTLRFDNGRFLTADGQAPARVPAEGLPTMEFYRQQILLGLKDYARRCGFRQAVVGSSGGIDSALTLALAAQALGPENVVGVTMPSRYSSSGSVDDSVALCQNLGVQLHTHPIAELVAGYAQQFESSFGQPLQGLPLENLQARIRGTVLMEYSNTFGHLLLTTGNKSEISVGYCTLYGDTNGGLGLIGDLYKTEVFSLSRHVNEQAGRELIPQAIIDKEPSAELAPGQRDVDSLPPYPVLDEVLKLLIEGERLSATELAAAQAFVTQLQTDDAGRALVQRVRMMVARNEYKRRQAPPILRVRPRAFGSGRQMPIAARYL